MRKFFSNCCRQDRDLDGPAERLCRRDSWPASSGPSPGPLFDYSDTWQLVINTGTTVLTFLLVFLIQNSQNRDGAAIQAKLDELLRAVDKARESIHRHRAFDRPADRTPARRARALGQEYRSGKQKTADDTVDRLLDRF